MISYEKIELEDEKAITIMSKIASEIVKEYYDPLLGCEQNDYMIQKFQSVQAIKEQIKHGYQYFFICINGQVIGFVAYYLRTNCLYLSKFYLYKQNRGKGYAREILQFLSQQAKINSKNMIELNVNKYNNTVTIYEKLGFKRIKEEKINIGNSFFMDDFVYELKI